MNKPQVRHRQLRGLRFRILYWPAAASTTAPTKTALLSHGTGLVAASWWLVAPQLARAGYNVYAIDRRGHGGSDRAAAGRTEAGRTEAGHTAANHGGNGYEFLDFAEDILALVDALELQAIYGIGHSAGSTDLLLAAALRPGLFDQLFVIDPTLSLPATEGATLPQQALDTLARVQQKRSRYPSAAAFRERALRKPPFALFAPAAFDAHLEQAFVHHRDGSVELCCHPDTEFLVMLGIYRAMHDCYPGDQRGEPFHRLQNLDCVTTIASSGQSMPIYRRMVECGLQLMPSAEHHHFAAQNHCVPMEAPDLTSEVLLQFARR